MTELPLSAYIEADVELLPTEGGGRRSPIASGYRCNCWIGGLDATGNTYNDATIFLVTGQLQPGTRGRVRVQPHSPDEWSAIHEGSRFDLCEGRKVVGTALVTKMFPAT